MSRGTHWVATVTGSGMEPFEVVADSQDELERRLGDLAELHLGRPRWTIEERRNPEQAIAAGDSEPPTAQLNLKL